MKRLRSTQKWSEYDSYSGNAHPSLVISTQDHGEMGLAAWHGSRSLENKHKLVFNIPQPCHLPGQKTISELSTAKPQKTFSSEERDEQVDLPRLKSRIRGWISRQSQGDDSSPHSRGVSTIICLSKKTPELEEETMTSTAADKYPYEIYFLQATDHLPLVYLWDHIIISHPTLA